MSGARLESVLVLVPRRLVVLLATGFIALAPAAPAFGQSAGDEQYSDPLGTSGQETTPMPPLSDDPAGSDAGSGSAAPTPSTAPPAPSAVPADATAAAATVTAATRTELPATGAEPGLVGALGAAFVLLGIGLRLRVADARA